MHLASVWGILPELAVIFKDNLVFHLYNKRNKTMYAKAKKKKKNIRSHIPLKIRGYGIKISILRDICFFDF